MRSPAAWAMAGNVQQQIGAAAKRSVDDHRIVQRILGQDVVAW
jgi:hypothetical protein